MSLPVLTNQLDNNYLSIAELLETYQAQHPNKHALVDVDLKLAITFAQLAWLVERTTHDLLALGIRPGTRAALFADNSISTVAVWLSLWRIGAVVCPIDAPSIPFQADDILGLVNPAHILSDDWHGTVLDIDRHQYRSPVTRFAQWSPGVESLIVRSTASKPSDDRPTLQQLPPVRFSSIASISCTSGTTGKPKAVVHDYAALWQNGFDSIELLGLRADDRTLEYRSLGWFSSQILSLIPFLQIGLTLHLARKFSLRNFPKWVSAHRITVSVGLPAVINLLLQHPIAEGKKPFESLRLITSSTAPLSAENWSAFEQTYGVLLLNLYGSSETGWISGNRFDAHRIGTVGRPASSVDLTIASESGEACPHGEPGLVTVNADKLALGYLHADSSVLLIRGRPFTMPDIATIDDDGYVRLHGRRDSQINRGGVKFYPIEIETVLLSHPAVHEALAIGVPDTVYGEKAVCFVVATQGSTFDSDQLLAYCSTRLPHNKTPSDIVQVDSLPRNHRGKLLRSSLAQMYTTLRQP